MKLKANLVRQVLLLAAGFSIAVAVLYFFYQESDFILPVSLGSVAGIATHSFLNPRRDRDVFLSETSITGPLRRGLRTRSVEVTLSSIDLNKSRLRGIISSSYLQMKNGERMYFDPTYYSRRKLKELFLEIKNRAQVKHHV